MQTVKIKELVSFVRGVSYKKEQASKEKQDQYTAILRANNINEGDFNFDDLVFVPSDLILDRQMIKKGDIVITMSSGSKAHVGKVAIATHNINAAFGAFCAKIVPEKIVPQYLYYLLRSTGFRRHIEIASKGTNINNIKQDYILDYEICLPSHEEQKSIVAKIEELFSELDNGVETLKKTKQQLAVYRQAVLKEAFDIALQCTDRMMTIEELLVTDRKGMATGPFGTMLKKHDHKHEGVPMLGIENIGEGKFIYGNKIFVTAEKAQELKSFVLKAGDIIISRSGTVGEICSVPSRMEGSLLSTNLMRVSLNQEVVLSEYFIYLFQSKGVVLDQVKELCKGSTRIFLNQTILKQIRFPIPSIKKQEQIIAEIESRMSICDSIEKTVDTALQQAEAMRQSILKKAFEGGFC